MAGMRVRRPDEIRESRRKRNHSCWGHLIVAPLWAQHGANLGTMLRTCDAVGACLAVPPHDWVAEALRRGNTVPGRSCVHRTGNPTRWIERERDKGARIVAVELVEGATRLADVQPARRRTVILLGHERTGIPEPMLDLADEAVEIPMIGRGASLNVAVSGSLVLYRLAGLL
ncbi:SpoU rRNA Methylase family protein [Gordonia malaquae]|jgi:tRNA (guanosine-2'-O-)-methyltransferase|uniref:tRNA (Guanosine-2'-O-)-methyltransferase n=1 Tax=Gordonia malaquae NBRC 108250 TaxID=1223542 RepID=M3UJE7_GORML|nr:TrmH family RNA methyltransferase [Gordonia malaquae]GAC79645.1 tRNA (guanosine-2'-O-)-methyltransferase [Gordonia malaquae NBRC 108250]SED78821.1 SpoU rRNA Methylase family protein [Gordonia malaquae]